MRWFWLFVGVLGCEPYPDSKADENGVEEADTDADDDTQPVDTADTDDSDSDAADNCWNTLAWVDPLDGSQDVYYRTRVRAQFSVADPAITVSMSGGVTGTTTWDENQITFEPSAALAQNTLYTATFEYPGCKVDVEFRTSDVGLPVLSTSCLVGTTFTVDLSAGNFVQPIGIGPVIAALLTSDLLLEPQAVSTTDIEAEVVVDDGYGQQDLCIETVHFATAFQNPYFSFGPMTTELDIGAYEVTIEDLTLSGDFDPTCTEIVGGRVSGLMDTRPLVPLLYPSGGDDEICLLVQTFGVSCIACPNGTGDYCLEALVEDLHGVVSNVDLVPRTAAEIAADPTCAP